MEGGEGGEEREGQKGWGEGEKEGERKGKGGEI